MQRLSLLQKEINKPVAPKPKTDPIRPSLDEASDLSGQRDRLEDMMLDRQNPGTEDPEIQQLSQTLDKILDIQHPQRVKDRLEQMSLGHKEKVFVVSKTAKEENISLLDTIPQKPATESGFYGLEDKTDGALTEGNAIEAIVSTNQTLVSGSVIKFRLTTDVYINGKLVPSGSFVHGLATINNERLEVEIKTIKCESSILPVNLVVYDVDGLEGIYIPGAITREVAKQSADNSLQMMELSSLDPSLKAQAATAGVHAAKSLLSRKVKQVKVGVKGGYRVLLKNR
ncbi:MAG TPA: conjugative transposon protein TraM [Flavisolibacter sp.]|nr:conjugative transposon protein TraM [Flavisolibacter sp.]